MRPTIRQILLVAALHLLWLGAASAQQYWGYEGPRYRYGVRGAHWYYGPYRGRGGSYYTFYYYYRPTPYATDYRYHTVFYYPTTVGRIKGGYYYYKNRVTGLYWGRCLAGSNQYELLPDSKRRPNLEDIDDGDFEHQGGMTPVPNMAPETRLIPPPRDPAPNGAPQE